MICPTCHGRGTVTCKRCGGKGHFSAPFMKDETCKGCGGSGEAQCTNCGGTGKK